MNAKQYRTRFFNLTTSILIGGSVAFVSPSLWAGKREDDCKKVKSIKAAEQKQLREDMARFLFHRKREALTDTKKASSADVIKDYRLIEEGMFLSLMYRLGFTLEWKPNKLFSGGHFTLKLECSPFESKVTPVGTIHTDFTKVDDFDMWLPNDYNARDLWENTPAWLKKVKTELGNKDIIGIPPGGRYKQGIADYPTRASSPSEKFQKKRGTCNINKLSCDKDTTVGLLLGNKLPTDKLKPPIRRSKGNIGMPTLKGLLRANYAVMHEYSPGGLNDRGRYSREIFEIDELLSERTELWSLFLRHPIWRQVNKVDAKVLQELATEYEVSEKIEPNTRECSDTGLLRNAKIGKWELLGGTPPTKEEAKRHAPRFHQQVGTKYCRWKDTSGQVVHWWYLDTTKTDKIKRWSQEWEGVTFDENTKKLRGTVVTWTPPSLKKAGFDAKCVPGKNSDVDYPVYYCTPEGVSKKLCKANEEYSSVEINDSKIKKKIPPGWRAMCFSGTQAP